LATASTAKSNPLRVLIGHYDIHRAAIEAKLVALE
jgi:hypothetical protein